ncbi:MAG: hypothetical protein FWG44_00225 [Oscillospiraceae bacterium]|nr:hypothetical protein [Oscillospiraceae bacterium]
MRKYKSVDSVYIPDNDPVTVKFCGNVIEIKYASHRNSEAHIKKLDKDCYIKLSENTGEVYEFKHGENRLNDTISVKRSLEELRDYINTNVINTVNCKWLTLTYAENMTEPKRLKDDFKEFNRLCRNQYGHYEYITAAEPQQRGAWHLHVILIFDKPAPYMRNSEVCALWGQGFVNVRKLNEVDNIGMYLTAYLADLPLDEAIQNTKNILALKVENVKMVESVNKNGKMETKAYIKGERMKMYPRGFHIHRESRGIKKPEKIKMKNSEAAKIVKDYNKIYEKSVEITDEDNSFTVVTNKRVYNKNPHAKKFLKGGADDE